MSKHIIDTLDKRIRQLKPSDKSDLSIIGGTLVSKQKVLEEIRKIRSISVGEMIEYLEQFNRDKEVFIRMPAGKQYNIYNMHDTELQAIERDTGELMNFGN